jgi:hypothetical protein
VKVHDIPSSGKRGKIVAFKSRFGQCQRQLVPPTKHRTTAQLRAQSAFGGASLGWNQLTEEQREAWCAAAKMVRSHPRSGQSGPLTGQNLFTAINRNQALLELPPFVYPPQRPEFGSNPVRALSITQGSAGIALRLLVTGEPAGHFLVFASRPYNAGRRYCDKFIYLGPLPPPTGGESDITELYLSKFGNPPAGSRVFINLWQQVNGWRDQPRRIEALFRPTPPPAAPAMRRRVASDAP